MDETRKGHATFPFADSHAHLTDPAFDADRLNVIDRARAAGCRAIVSIGASLEHAQLALTLASEHRGFVFATAGVHPHDASGFEEARDIPAIRETIARGAVAIGECGLDYHYDHSPREVQRRVFDAQIALASETKKPVVVHTREAEADTIDAVRAAGKAGVRGILHCFTGSATLADTALAEGWYVTFAGVVTFRKWEGDDLIRFVPRDRLLAETDSPYLAPVPFRGKRNEPMHVPRVVEHLARARNEDVAAVGQQVAANTIACFGLQERFTPERRPR
jgi:TatD DNase family protein